MKIFNWVHRRFIPRDGLGQNHVKKHEEIPLANSNDDHAEDTAALLLDKVVPDDDDDEMLQLFQGHNYDGWGGAGAGILSIGTFGLDKTLGINIHPEPNNKEYFGLRGKDGDQEPESEDDDDRQRSDEEEESDHHDDNVEDDESDCEEEWNPLVYDKSGAQRPIDASALVIGNSSSSSSIHNDAKPVRPPGNLQLQPDSPDHDDEHIHSNYSSYRRIMINTKKEKERITLADLFSADSDDAIWIDGTAKNNIPSRDYLQAQCIKNKAASATPHPPDRAPKNGTLLFPKKLIPLVKQDSRPIQKLHGLMKRMLKRKIHPDVAAAGKNNTCAANRQFGINESVSLLQSQGQFCADKNM